MNKQAVLAVLNSLEVAEINGGEDAYILVANNEENRKKLNDVGVSDETIRKYGGDDEFICILALAFHEGYADNYESGKFVQWGPIDDELRHRVLNGEGTALDAERLLKELERFESVVKPEIDWYKTSNTLIEVNKSFCPRCDEPFHEIDGHELDSCPHCEMTLVGESISWDEQVYVRIYVDHKTGELKVWGADSDD